MLNLFKIIFFVVLLSGCNYAFSCELNIHGPSPLFTKDFGSKTIIFKAREKQLFFDNGESITAYCNNQMAVTGGYNYQDTVPTPNDRTAVFSCVGNSIQVNGKNLKEKVRVSCSPEATLVLYESNRNLPKCAPLTSYAFGVKLSGVGDVIKAGVCYDLERLTLKFATYIAHNKKVSVVKRFKAASMLSVDLGQKVSDFYHYFDFINENSLAYSPQLTQLSINSKEFEFVSLLQNEPLNTELASYAYIFNTMWWRQLRQESWRHFLDALRERTQSVNYLVYTGTYGNITIPEADGNCSAHKSEVVAVRNEDMTVQAPAYIWAYLRSLTPGETEEFVVVGHNSPYAKNPGHSEFCSVDICDDIAWLKESQFGNLRRLPALGYTFCCRPEEVAKVIDYIPLKDDEVETTTQSRMVGTLIYPEQDEWMNDV